MNWLTRLKRLTLYEREGTITQEVIRPVRVDGKPAKHLERMEEEQVPCIREGWFRPKVTRKG